MNCPSCACTACASPLDATAGRPAEPLPASFAFGESRDVELKGLSGTHTLHELRWNA